MAKEKYELRVGLFILIGIVLIVVIVFSIGDIYIYKPGYHLKAKFGFVNGLEIGAPLRLAGVSVGKIEGVDVVREKVSSKTFVDVLLWINKDVAIEKDAKFLISTWGMFGEKYVEISPGTPGSEVLKDGNIVAGKDPMSMERFSEQIDKIAREATSMLESINGLIGDEKFTEDLKASVAESKVLIQDMRKVSLKADEVLDRINKGEGTVGKLLKEEELYNDLRDFVKDLKAHPWKLLRAPKEKK